MKYIKANLLLLALFLVLYYPTLATEYKVVTSTDKNGYSYEEVQNDPLKARIYTLKNGFKVYLSVNKDAPRIQTFIAVKAGSTYDPKETTGLAHYLEHMMFKGTDKIGSSDWTKESKYLEEIKDLYEKHKAEPNNDKKKAIYHLIDSVSGVSANVAIANEYDKMIGKLGAKGTNAYTWHEQTVYVNDIAANEIQNWLKLERERFGKLVLRLFHTELEAVYEEFNMGQDNDYRKVYEAMNTGMFKKHPYGTQTTIGEANHLKNPSLINIHNYFDKYYIPNNMAMCLSGDFDPEATLKMIDATFGTLTSKPISPIVLPKEDLITSPVVMEVKGPEAEALSIGYRFEGANSYDEKIVTLINGLLSNSKAGLMDLNLVQKQKVLTCAGSAYFMRDYGMQNFDATPRAGQKLEDLKDLILAEIEKIKNGDFEDWLLPAVINNLKLQDIQARESNNARASAFVDIFIKNVPYIDNVKFIDELEKITKAEIIKFAKEHYSNNYVIVYKRTGKDDATVKVDKPIITPVSLNRDSQSDFLKNFNKLTAPKIEPVFVDFKNAINKTKLNNDIELSSIKNTSNELFSLSYILEMGKDNNKLLPLAVNYLPLIGTNKYSAADLQKELFKLGLSFSVYSADNRSYVTVSGLEKSFVPAVELLEHILANAKADKFAYQDYVQSILKDRTDSKLNKDNIFWSGLMSYGKYGDKSPFSDIIPEEKLDVINPDELTGYIKDLTSFKHKVFYYGSQDNAKLIASLNNLHKVPTKLKEIPTSTKYIEQPTNKKEVLFVNYDMVQASLMMLSKGGSFDKSELPYSRVFSEYFGGGLSSIVFQEIRESKALAYSAFAAYSQPQTLNKSNWVFGYVGTQGDKLENATNALSELMQKMPKAEKQFNSCKDAIMRKIETERIIKSNIYFTYLSNMDRGLDYDYRKDIYEKLKTMTIDDLANFFNSKVKSDGFKFLVMGNKNTLDMKLLNKFGNVREVSLNELFGY